MPIEELEFNIAKQKSLELLIRAEIDYKKLEKNLMNQQLNRFKKLLNHKLYL